MYNNDTSSFLKFCDYNNQDEDNSLNMVRFGLV